MTASRKGDGMTPRGFDDVRQIGDAWRDRKSDQIGEAHRASDVPEIAFLEPKLEWLLGTIESRGGRMQDTSQAAVQISATACRRKQRCRSASS
jgi:hypothetical protein